MSQLLMVNDVFMAKKSNTFVSELLGILKDLGDMVPLPFETPYAWVRRASGTSRKSYYNTIRALEKRGAVKVSRKAGKRFIRLTQKGELEVLLAKSILKKIPAWDGKWRIVMFDIPEQAREHRDRFRWLLKKNHYVKIQQSVFISPWPLNIEAVKYLKASGLNKYIRILRVDVMDEDKDLRKIFKLRHA